MEDQSPSADERCLLEIYQRSTPDRQVFIVELIATMNGSCSLEQAIELAPPHLREKIIKYVAH